jgi:hypothetical protein
MELWITQISGRSYSVISLETGLKQRPQLRGHSGFLYFHCKKSGAYIWRLSTGLAHFGTSRRSPRSGAKANQGAQQPQ